jgi:hypothetical protein
LTTCAIVAQTSIYESITGTYYSETLAAEYAEAQGWFDPTVGTPLEYSGKILDALGVPTKIYENADFQLIIDAVAQGDKVIAGVDAREIWSPRYDSEGNPLDQGNDIGHAVWVTGLDPEPGNTLKVILNDSGTPSGRMEVVDYLDFTNAWADYSFSVTVVDV